MTNPLSPMSSALESTAAAPSVLVKSVPGWAIAVVLLVSCGALYLHWLNGVLLRQPPEIFKHSPRRLSPKEVAVAADEFRKSPVRIEDHLPPATGHRYIVVGGAGFLGGWIVRQLIARGEDPERIRVLDIASPARAGFLSGPVTRVAFMKTDVSDASAVSRAFAAPWPDGVDTAVPLTVFHSAANIRFFERHERTLHRSARVNVNGTANVVAAARAAGASVLVYTSSGSVSLPHSRFWLWPWESSPQPFALVIDEDTPLPPKSSTWSNYAATKAAGEALVLAADDNSLRTAAIRPGNGVFGPGGDVLCGAFLARRVNPMWVSSVLQSFCYVENAALAHLALEAALRNPDHAPAARRRAFVVADAGPPCTFGDVQVVEATLAPGTRFPHIPPAPILLVAYLLEAYECARFYLPFLPAPGGELINLQPPLLSLASVHMVFKDARARKVIGYDPPFTTFTGLVRTVDEFLANGSRAEGRQRRAGGGGVGFGLHGAQSGVEHFTEGLHIGSKDSRN